MVDPVKALGSNWPVPVSPSALMIENFTAEEIPNCVGLPREAVVAKPTTRTFRGQNRRRTSTKFIRASSRELERQLWELAVGRIDELPKPPPGIRRVVLTAPLAVGERRFCMQLCDVLTRLGCEWCACSKEVARMVEKMNPDIFISLGYWLNLPAPDAASGIVSMLYIHSPNCVSPANYQRVSAYDNFLFAQDGTAELEEYFRENGKNFHRLKTYLTLGRTDFCDVPKERIAYVGYFAEPRRRDEFAKLFQLLDEAGYCDFYGAASSWQKKHFRSWKAEMPFRNLTDVQDVMRPAGIALLLHSEQQFKSGSAVYRDFEALSSSCVIITEKTAFMEQNFGDCALFIDTEKPVEEIFEQIDTHVKWIHAHPEEAVEMARKSHQIFCDKFSLEGECEKILKFADEILSASRPAPSNDNALEPEAMDFLDSELSD